jgi:hypothetical protein
MGVVGVHVQRCGRLGVVAHPVVACLGAGAHQDHTGIDLGLGGYLTRGVSRREDDRQCDHHAQQRRDQNRTAEAAACQNPHDISSVFPASVPPVANVSDRTPDRQGRTSLVP